MIIRKPTRKDLPQLSALWQEAFGDSPEDVQNFYETAFSCDRALLAQEQNPVACIYWIDAQIAGQKVAYLYALAVDRACRNQGVGKTLLRKALETLKGEGYKAAILVPGEESLYAYYKNVGFTPFGKTEKTTIEKKAPPLPASKVSPEAYVALRNKANPDVIWPQEAASYLGRFCDFYAGEDWLLALGQKEVQEFIGRTEDLPHVLYTLNMENVHALVPGKKPCAMAYSFVQLALPDTFGPSF